MVAETRSVTVTHAGGNIRGHCRRSLVAIFLSRSISRATQFVLAQAEAIAAGDLTGEEMRVQARTNLAI